MRVTALALALVITSATCAFADESVPHAIDAAKSRASFSVQHVFVEHVTGTVPIVSGSVVLPPDSSTPDSLTAQLDPGKVASGDRDRDSSLVSPDFFDVKDYPVWTFTSTKITPVSATAFGLDGSLTIHGVSAPEHLDVTIHGDAAHRVYHAFGHVDRRAFHMPVTRLDPAIGNIVDTTLDITLK